MPDLARMIGGTPDGLVLRPATVTAPPATDGTATIRFGTGATPISGIRALASASFTTGDVVWVVQNGYDMLIIGKVGKAVVDTSSSSPTFTNVTVTGTLRVTNAAGGSGKTRFWDGLELGHPSSTPYIDFHRSSNPEEATDYNVRVINEAAGDLKLYGNWRVSSDYYHDGQWIRLNNDSTENGIYWQVRNGKGGFGWHMTDTTYMRVYGNGGLYSGGEFRSNHRFYCSSGARDDMVMLGPWGDYMIGVRSETLMLQSWTWLSMDTRNGGANRMFDWHRWDGCYLRNNAWFRTQGSGGFYLSDALWGVKSDGGSSRKARSENDENMLKMVRISQGGWSTAAFENNGSSGSVPQYAWHASNERAAVFRKDNGGWNGVWVDQNGACASIFGAGHGICSDEARKTDIRVLEDVGLKTIRGLVPKTYRYKPVTENEIWNTWKDRDERASGKWKYRVGTQEGWEVEHVGYMAEEIYNRFPLAAYLDPLDGRPWAIDYGKLTIAAISAINELADRIEDLEAQLERERWRHAA